MIRYDPSEKQHYLIWAVNALSGNTVNTHIMASAPNAAKTEAAWQIMKLTYDASDNLTDKQFPRNSAGIASADYSFIANSYASYSYGPA